MKGDTQAKKRPGWQAALKVPFEWLDTGLDWFERSTLIICILAMATVSVANVMSRNLLGGSLQYAHDVAQILLVIVTFMGIGIGARHARHIRVSAIHDLLPHKAQKVLLIIVSFSTAGLLFLLSSYAWTYATAAQRSCRILPDTLNLHFSVSVILVITILALFGHLVRLGREYGGARLEQLAPLWQKVALTASLIIGLAIAAWFYGLFMELVDNRTGRCRIMSSTGMPVYLVYMVVPLGFLLGGIQFFLGGVRNLISADNYLSWHNRDEYDTVDELAAQTGLPASEVVASEPAPEPPEPLSDEDNRTRDGEDGDKGGKDNG